MLSRRRWWALITLQVAAVGILAVLGAMLPGQAPLPQRVPGQAAQPSVFAERDDWRRRDQWQRPADVINALDIGPGDVVADIGSGRGYFSFHLAERVGPTGKVYAQDVDEDTLDSVRKLARKYSYAQSERGAGRPPDPRLPQNALDGALIVNAYHEMRQYDPMLRGIFQALKPGARLAIIDPSDEAGRERKQYQRSHTISPELVREDAERNGFRFLGQESGFHNPERSRDWFFLTFEKPAAAAAKAN
jgi:predicted methyltransferase